MTGELVVLMDGKEIGRVHNDARGRLLHQWQKFARETRLNADELIARLGSMAKQLPDETDDARKLAQAEGLDKAIIDRLATRLIERAGECERVLAGK